MRFSVPKYFDYLIEEFEQGEMNRFVHLGHWDQPADVSPNTFSATGEFERAQERLNEVLFDMADIHHEYRVLDVGCGFGGMLQTINNRFGNMSLVGVNIDPRQLAICQQLEPRNENQFDWVEADACKLPLPAQSFDRVFCIEAMFHFRSRRDFFAEVARVLRPQGVMVLSDIVFAHPATKTDFPGFCLEAPIQDGYGPWPDFWGDDADHRVLGKAVGLTCTHLFDATANTHPSHQFTVPEGADPWRDPGNIAIRAAMMLRWLHDQDLLKYIYMRFDKSN
jgi:MPBQ/MSBQ methyltransferase